MMVLGITLLVMFFGGLAAFLSSIGSLERRIMQLEDAERQRSSAKWTSEHNALRELTQQTKTRKDK